MGVHKTRFAARMLMEDAVVFVSFLDTMHLYGSACKAG